MDKSGDLGWGGKKGIRGLNGNGKNTTKKEKEKR